MRDVKTNQYSVRDVMELDVIGNYYSTHVSAMTSEKLCGKSDIAAELAFRDCEIDRLAADNESLSKELDNIKLQLKLQQDLFDASEQDARDSETVNDEYIALLHKQSKKLLHSLTKLVSTSESNERQLSDSLADFPFTESTALKQSKLLIQELND